MYQLSLNTLLFLSTAAWLLPIPVCGHVTVLSFRDHSSHKIRLTVY